MNKFSFPAALVALPSMAAAADSSITAVKSSLYFSDNQCKTALPAADTKTECASSVTTMCKADSSLSSCAEASRTEDNQCRFAFSKACTPKTVCEELCTNMTKGEDLTSCTMVKTGIYSKNEKTTCTAFSGASSNSVFLSAVLAAAVALFTF